MNKRNPGFDEMLGLPWWLTLILGIVAYVALKYILPNIEYNHPILISYTRAWQNFAGLVALLFLLAAAVSFFRSAKKHNKTDTDEQA